MSKKQLENLFTKTQRSKIPIPIPRSKVSYLKDKIVLKNFWYMENSVNDSN